MIAKATAIRGLLRLTLVAVLSWQAAAHSVQNGRMPPTYEELSTSLILNQLAILQLMHDTSNATCAAVEMQREGDAVRKEAERLEEAFGAQVDRVQATLEARQRQHMQQMFNALNRTAEDILTKVADLRKEMREELTNNILEIREELTNVILEAQITPRTPATEQPTTEVVPELPEGTLPSLCSGNKTLYGKVGALEVVRNGTYAHHELCSWDLHFPTESSVSLTWEFMDVESCSNCACDWVRVFDVTNSQYVYGWGLCARDPSSSLLQFLNVIVPGTRNLLVTFRSDHSSVGEGFRMLYRAH